METKNDLLCVREIMLQSFTQDARFWVFALGAGCIWATNLVLYAVSRKLDDTFPESPLFSMKSLKVQQRDDNQDEFLPFHTERLVGFLIVKVLIEAGIWMLAYTALASATNRSDCHMNWHVGLTTLFVLFIVIEVYVGNLGPFTNTSQPISYTLSQDFFLISISPFLYTFLGIFSLILLRAMSKQGSLPSEANPMQEMAKNILGGAIVLIVIVVLIRKLLQNVVSNKPDLDQSESLLT